METKRRLFYLPEDEVVMDELTGSPRPRPSRVSRLLVPPSSEEESERGAGADSSAPRVPVDPALLVAYGPHVVADGSGALRPPPAPAEAAALRRSLRRCCRALRACARDESSAGAVADSASESESQSSSAGLGDADYSQSSRYSGSRRKERQRLRQKQQQQQQGTKAQKRLPDECDSKYESLTVLELREKLRERNLPISGTKKLLLLRLQGDDEHQETQTKEACPWNESVPRSGASSAERSCFSLESETECASKTVWGTLLDMGSRFFRKSTSSHLPSGEVDRKRRRSA